MMPIERIVDETGRPRLVMACHVQADVFTLQQRLELECAWRGWSVEQAAEACGVTAERFLALQGGHDLPTADETRCISAAVMWPNELDDDDTEQALDRHLLVSLKQRVKSAAKALWPQCGGAIPQAAAAERLAELAPQQRETLARGMRVASDDFPALLNAMRRTAAARVQAIIADVIMEEAWIDYIVCGRRAS